MHSLQLVHRAESMYGSIVRSSSVVTALFVAASCGFVPGEDSTGRTTEDTAVAGEVDGALDSDWSAPTTPFPFGWDTRASAVVLDVRCGSFSRVFPLLVVSVASSAPTDLPPPPRSRASASRRAIACG